MNFEQKGTLIRNISYSFEVNDLILDNISFELHEGKILSILGPSGCGKSTLLRLIAGLLNTDKNNITINGYSPTQLQTDKKIGIAFQDSCLIDWLTVKQNILIPCKIGIKSENEQESQDRADLLISLIGLAKYKDFYPSQLSGGMKQRVSFARALINQPQLLLLDEPFSALDSFTKTKLMIDFSEILSKENVTTIFITHNIEEAIFLSDKILILTDKPSTILKEIEIHLSQPRSLDAYNSLEFEKIMKDCRNLLMNNRNEIQ